MYKEKSIGKGVVACLLRIKEDQYYLRYTHSLSLSRALSLSPHVFTVVNAFRLLLLPV